MKLAPIAKQEQVQGTAQQVLAYLDDPTNKTPNNMLEAIVSGKSLLRGIITGQLIVCQQLAPEKEKCLEGPPAEDDLDLDA